MEDLNRFDLASFDGVPAVIVESEFLPPDASVVVIPLLRNYPAIAGLNPEFDIDGQKHVLATRLIVAVNRRNLKRIGSIAEQGDKITRAIDVLMSGV